MSKIFQLFKGSFKSYGGEEEANVEVKTKGKMATKLHCWNQHKSLFSARQDVDGCGDLVYFVILSYEHNMGKDHILYKGDKKAFILLTYFLC